LGMDLKAAVQLAGAITEVHAPVHRTGEAAAETRKGFATGMPAPDSEVQEPPASSRRRLVIVAGVVVAAGALALWLGLRGPKTSGPPTMPTEPSPALAVPAPAPVAPASVPPAPVVAPVPPPAPPPLQQVAQPLPIHARASRAGVHQSLPAGRASPASPPVEVNPTAKPSRAAKQGLIQENPF
jgi:hypothetical protein